MSTGYSELEQRLLAWGQQRPEVRALVVIGSYARAGAADEHSDLDVLAFVTSGEAFATDLDWLEPIGVAWLAHLERIFRGSPDWMLSLEDGTRLDIAFVNLEGLPGEHLGAWLESLDLQVFRRGLRVLLDKTDAPGLPVFAPLVWLPPSQEQFERVLHAFLYAATRTARFLRRGDLWRAGQECDHGMAGHLLTCLEWHAHAIYAPGGDTWYGGRNLERWADPRAVQALPGCFGGYDARRLASAASHQLRLMQTLGGEVAAHFGYPFPEGSFARVAALIAMTDEPGGS